MRKLMLVFMGVFVMSMATNAQEMFKVGTQVFKAGIGLNSNAIPVEISYEKGVKSDLFGVEDLVLGIGGNIGYFAYKGPIIFGYSYKYTNIIVAGRALAHYPIIDKFDTYAGIMLGYNVGSSKFDGPAGSDTNPPVGGIVYGGIVGARYEFNEKWGAYAELGYSTSYANIGVAYKF